MTDTIFVTGATGNIGARLTASILEAESNTELILLVRGPSPAAARKRLTDAVRTAAPDLPAFHICRVTVVRGDITQERFGLSDKKYRALARRVTHIIHSAAATKFNLPLSEARAVNVEGTATVMAFARQVRRLSRLQGVAYISTAFVCGGRAGEFREDDPGDGQDFSNSYEQSKWEAERYVRRLMGELPISIFRPSIVVGDSRTGRTLLFNVLYMPLRCALTGRVKVLPCSPSASLDVVPVDYVADTIRHIFLSGEGPGQTYHVVAGRRASCTVERIVAHVGRYLERKTDGEKVPTVTYLSQDESAAQSARGRRRDTRMREMLRVFDPYVNAPVTFDDTRTAAALAGTGIQAPRLTDYFDTLLDYSFSTQWGRRLRLAS